MDERLHVRPDPDDERYVWINGHRIARVMGGEGDDDGGTDDDAGQDDDSGQDDDHDDDEGDDHGRSGRSEDSGSDDDSGDADDEDDDDRSVKVDKDEYNRLKRKASEADKAKKKAEREERKRQERERRESGQWEEIISEKDERIDEVEAERDEARHELESYKREVRVTSSAARLGFKDPQDVMSLVSEEETEDEQQTERALKRLARAKPYLVSPQSSTGAPVDGGGGRGGSGLTMEEVKKMTTEEVNARWDEVQKVMAGEGAS